MSSRSSLRTTATKKCFDSIPAGKTATITMPVYFVDQERNNAVFRNTATVTFDGYYEMTNSLTDNAQIIVRSPSPPVSPGKVSLNYVPTVNEVVTYQLRPRPLAGQVYQDLLYLDTIPAGLEFIDYGTMNTSYDVTTLEPVENADGTTTIGWWFGDISGNNGYQYLPYTVRVPNEMPDGTPIVDGDVFTNTARGYTNEENLITTLTEIPAAPDLRCREHHDRRQQRVD